MPACTQDTQLISLRISALLSCTRTNLSCMLCSRVKQLLTQAVYLDPAAGPGTPFALVCQTSVLCHCFLGASALPVLYNLLCYLMLSYAYVCRDHIRGCRPSCCALECPQWDLGHDHLFKRCSTWSSHPPAQPGLIICQCFCQCRYTICVSCLCCFVTIAE